MAFNYMWCPLYRWLLDLHLPVQSVPITTKVVSSNSLHGEVCSIQHYVITFVSNLRQVCGCFRVLRFPQPIKLIATKVASNFKNQSSFHSATKHDSHAQFQIIWLELLKIFSETTCSKMSCNIAQRFPI